jgi:hypothetical protein
MSTSDSRSWRRAQSWATPIVVLVLGLFYYWFGVADRYAIFLYGHATDNMPPAQPFDGVTSSRYWMAGLVAAGIVMVLYVTECVLVGRVAVARGHRYHAPSWWRVWALCLVPLAIGIPAITLTVNTPTLTHGLAAKATLAALGGLALALLPGEWAVRRPVDLAWLVADAAGLVPALIVIRVVELPGRGVWVSAPVAWSCAIGGCLAGLAWMALLSVLRRRARRPRPAARTLLVAGLGLSYLLLPLAHHISTPAAYRYITTASNFFAWSLSVQIVALGVAAAQAAWITRARRRAGWLRVR